MIDKLLLRHWDRIQRWLLAISVASSIIGVALLIWFGITAAGIIKAAMPNASADAKLLAVSIFAGLWVNGWTRGGGRSK